MDTPRYPILEHSPFLRRRSLHCPNRFYFITYPHFIPILEAPLSWVQVPPLKASISLLTPISQVLCALHPQPRITLTLNRAEFSQKALAKKPPKLF